MFNFTSKLLVRFLIIGLCACSTPSNMVEKGDIQLGMTSEDFQSKMFWGVPVEDDPWQTGHGGSDYTPGYRGFYFVFGGQRDKIFVFSPDNILVAIASTSQEAEFKVDRIVSNKVSKPSKQKLVKKPSDTLGTDEFLNITSNEANSKNEIEAEQLRNELAALKSRQKRQQQIISQDVQIPMIQVYSANTNGKRGIIRGQATDNTGIAEISIDGQQVSLDPAGNFKFSTFVPATGKEVVIEITDHAGLSNTKTVMLSRLSKPTADTLFFKNLDPTKRKAASNLDAVALIVGIDDYSKTTARAAYADNDARLFADYATEKLGIPARRVKVLINGNADESGVILAIKRWLSRVAKQGKSDVYIFFAGHGLASDDGQKMYLLPYDGSPELLEKTAILRQELFDDIASANPRSVTVFLDTCYSGTTRGTDMLIASRPIAIKALKQSVPDNFTVMTAARGDQTAKPLEEAKHGMFSYFLMKGMEGEADSNQDNKITAGELHSYVKTNVQQQSSGSQTPELQGDADRVLVQFQ